MTVATTDGASIWAFRYSSEGKSRSLFYSTDVRTLVALHPEVEVLHQLGEETRFVVSEPLRDLPARGTRWPSRRASSSGPGRTSSCRSPRGASPHLTSSRNRFDEPSPAP